MVMHSRCLGVDCGVYVGGRRGVCTEGGCSELGMISEGGMRTAGEGQVPCV